MVVHGIETIWMCDDASEYGMAVLQSMVKMRWSLGVWETLKCDMAEVIHQFEACKFTVDDYARDTE